MFQTGVMLVGALNVGITPVEITVIVYLVYQLKSSSV
jgi:hypothetical protein